MILAGRYGTPQPEHNGKSVTELEFEAAVESGRTLHAFFLNYISDFSNGLDDDAGRARLEAFKTRVQCHCTAKFCADEAELAKAITILAAAPPPRPGATAADPTLLAHATPHNLPFRARSGDGLVGRENALSRLEALLEEDGGPVHRDGWGGKDRPVERPLPRLHQLHPLLHDLFAAAARDREPEERRERQERLVVALGRWLPTVSDVLEGRSLERCQRCLPLLEALAQWPPERWGAGASAAWPLLALGRLRAGLGAYGLAVEALEAGLKRAQPLAEGAGLRSSFLVVLAGIARERGQLEAAERQCRQALALLEPSGEGGEEGSKSQDLERAEALNGLGLVLHERGEPSAEGQLGQALELRRQRLGDDHPLVQASRNNLARTLTALGRFDEANALYQQALSSLGEEPCEVGMAVHNNLASLALEEGRAEEAFAELEEAVRLAGLAMGKRHPRRGMLLKNLGIVAEQLGHRDAAEQHYRKALELVSEAWGPEDPRSEDCRLTLEAFLAERQA